jgi:hypothetical protein
MNSHNSCNQTAAAASTAETLARQLSSVLHVLSSTIKQIRFLSSCTKAANLPNHKMLQYFGANVNRFFLKMAQ